MQTLLRKFIALIEIGLGLTGLYSIARYALFYKSFEILWVSLLPLGLIWIGGALYQGKTIGFHCSVGLFLLALFDIQSPIFNAGFFIGYQYNVWASYSFITIYLDLVSLGILLLLGLLTFLSLENKPTKFLKRWGKRLFVGYVVLLSLIYFAVSVSVYSKNPTVFDIIDLPTVILSHIGVYAFFFKYPLFNQKFWKIWLPAVIIWDFFFNTVLSTMLHVAQLSVPQQEKSYSDFFLVSVIFWPIWIGLYYYAYRADYIWEQGVKRGT